MIKFPGREYRPAGPVTASNENVFFLFQIQNALGELVRKATKKEMSPGSKGVNGLNVTTYTRGTECESICFSESRL